MGKVLKITKIGSVEILNLAHFFRKEFPYPVKHRITWNLEFMIDEMPF